MPCINACQGTSTTLVQQEESKARPMACVPMHSLEASFVVAAGLEQGNGAAFKKMKRYEMDDLFISIFIFFVPFGPFLTNRVVQLLNCQQNNHGSESFFLVV